MKIARAIALATAAALMMSAASADTKQTKRHRQQAKTVTQPAKTTGHEPAHMIEVRPGRWISSYGCITDEGYGRFSPCDFPDSSQ